MVPVPLSASLSGLQTLEHNREIVLDPIIAAPVFREWVVSWDASHRHQIRCLQELQNIGVAKAGLRVTMDTLWGSLSSCSRKAKASPVACCALSVAIGHRVLGRN